MPQNPAADLTMVSTGVSARPPGGKFKATVAYARPEHQWLVEVELDAAATVRDAVDASGLMEVAARYEPDGILGVGINCRRLGWDAPVAAGDRVEIYRPLRENPRERRRRLAREEAGR